jgi:hypothetical protein
MSEARWAAHDLERGWLVDTGVGGSFDWNVEQAKWWSNTIEAMNELRACEIPTMNILLLRVR